MRLEPLRGSDPKLSLPHGPALRAAASVMAADLASCGLSPDAEERWMRRIDFLGEYSIEAYKRSREPAQILPRLWLGDARAAKPASVNRLGFDAVLNLAPEETRRRDGSSYAARDLEFLSIEATDRPDYDLLGQHLSEAADFLERVGAAGESAPAQAGAGALVHCFAGVNRSAALVVAFVVTKLRWSLLRTLRHVHERRPIVLTNLSFRLQLIRMAAREGLLLDEETVAASTAQLARSQTTPRLACCVS